MVRNDGLRHAVMLEDTVEEDPGQFGCGGRLVARDEMSVACEPVANDPDGVVAMQRGKLDNVVHCDGTPGTVQDV